MTVNDVGPEATECAVGRDHKDFCDPVREELRGVGDMPRFIDREGEASKNVKDIGWEVW